MRKLVDCTWTRQDHEGLSQRNRSFLQQTEAGRKQLRAFASAPLLMDARKTKVTGEEGAIKINQLRLEVMSAETQKPIFVVRAYHDKPNPEQLDPEQKGSKKRRVVEEIRVLDVKIPKEMEMYPLTLF